MDCCGLRRGRTPPSSSRYRGLTPAQEEERRRCVHADGTRKRAALHYKKQRAPVPVTLLRRETKEFEHRMWGKGSSSRAPRTPLPPVKKEEEEEQLAEGRIVTSADYATDEASFERLMEVIQQRSVAEAEVDAARASRDKDIDNILLEQGLARDRKDRAKKLQGDLVQAAQVDKYVDLSSDTTSGLSDNKL